MDNPIPWLEVLGLGLAIALSPLHVALLLLLLLGLSVGLQVATPDDVFLYAKATASLLASHLDGFPEVLGGVVFSLSTSLILLLPLLALVIFGQEKARPPLQQLKQWLVVNGDPLVGVVSLLLAGYLGWQGIEGLRVA